MGKIGRAKDLSSDLIWKYRCKIFPQDQLEPKSMEEMEASLSDDDPKAGPAIDPTFGVDPVVKTFYEGRDSEAGYYNWVDYPPKQLSKAAAKAQDRVAIKVYKVKDTEKPVIGLRFALKYHQIEVQNPTLVAALEPILKKQDVHLDVNNIATFKSPFHELYFCYEDIIAAYRDTKDEALRGYLHLFIRTLNDLFGDLRIKKKQLQANGLINFKTAWTFFPRGTVLYSYGRNSELLCKVESCAYRKTECGLVLGIECKVLGFNGEAFHWITQTLEIPQFAGNKPITELMHHPLEFNPDKENVRKRLTERGKRVLDLQGLTYCTYQGVAIYRPTDGSGEMQRHNVNGRILIDVVGFNKYHLSQGKREGKDPESKKNQVTHIPQPAADSPGTEAPMDKTGSKRLSEEDQAKNKEEMLAKPDDLVFMSPLIEGYALKNKLWCKC